jgi:hypothetical protein
LKNKDKVNNTGEVVQNNSLDCVTNEEEQLEISQQFLLESYVEEEENNVQSYNYFIDSLGHEELCNLGNAMEGLDIISNYTNSSIEAKTELTDQESCKHDGIKGRCD